MWGVWARSGWQARRSLTASLLFPRVAAYGQVTNSEVENKLRLVYEHVPVRPEETKRDRRWARYSGISPDVRRAIVDDLGWDHPTDIQRRIFNLVQKDRSIVASSETGSGKTAAYGAPLISYICQRRRDAGELAKEREPEDSRYPRGEYSPIGVIVVPTQELALQVKEHLSLLAAQTTPPIRIEALAHQHIPETLREPRGLQEQIDIVVGTPGKILSHAKQHSKYRTNKHNPDRPDHFAEQGLDLSWTRWFVIDECDRLLSMGFFPDIKDILTYMPRPRKKVPQLFPGAALSQEEREGRKVITSVEDRMKVLLFTATMVPEIQSLIKRIAPQHSSINLNPTLQPSENIDDVVHLVSNRRKFALLKYLLKRRGSMKYDQVLVFCRTQQRVERLTEALKNENILTTFIHKDMTPKQRTDVLQSFRNNQVQVLVATDVVGRGIDIEDLPFVVNYDLPISPADYIHRVGRTGRAGKKGTAISFVASTPMILNYGGRYVEHNEQHILQRLRSFTGKSLHFRKVPGPWSDDPYDTIVQHEEMDAQQAQEKRHKEVMKLMHSTEERVLGKGMLERLAARAEARKKNPTRARYMPETELTRGLSLRHFRHGRYEDMIVDYDVERARSRGVVVPNNFTDKVNKGKKKSKKPLITTTSLSKAPPPGSRPSPFTVQ